MGASLLQEPLAGMGGWGDGGVEGREGRALSRYAPILTENPTHSEAQNLQAALSCEAGLLQLSPAWKVCLQQHPHSCNNKHLQLQELC